MSGAGVGTISGKYHIAQILYDTNLHTETERNIRDGKERRIWATRTEASCIYVHIIYTIKVERIITIHMWQPERSMKACSPWVSGLSRLVVCCGLKMPIPVLRSNVTPRPGRPDMTPKQFTSVHKATILRKKLFYGWFSNIVWTCKQQKPQHLRGHGHDVDRVNLQPS